MSEELDPLEEREAQQEEVQRKRLLEEMDEDARAAAFALVLRNEAVRDYLWDLMSRCNVLGEPFDSNFGRAGYNMGRASVGRMVLADINQSDPQAWLEMQLKAARVAQALMHEKSRKKLRRPATP
jgi:hypothetical protein